MKIEGKVLAISEKAGGKYSIKVRDSSGNIEWYGGFKQAGVIPVEKGDNAEVIFHKSPDGEWNNIDKVNKLEGEPQSIPESKPFTPRTPLKESRDDFIMLQTASKIMGSILEKIIEKDTNSSEKLMEVFDKGDFTKFIAKEAKSLVSLWKEE